MHLDSTRLTVETTSLPEVLVVEPAVFEDDRGFLTESYNEQVFRERTGVELRFVQDNHSRSFGRVLRGIHYQLAPSLQGKLVRVVTGAVFDVAVDLRRGSPHFGHWVGVELSAENRKQLWVPPGFGHGFVTLAETTDLLYKVTTYHSAASERAVRWDDPDIGIAWPLEGVAPKLSAKDATAPFLADADTPSIDEEGAA